MKKKQKFQINNILRSFKKTKKKTCFFFGNTSKIEQNNFYLSEIRENSKFIYVVGIFFNNKSVKKIAKIIDGKVNLVLVDTEKKIISLKNKEIVNIEKVVKQNVMLSKIYTYKGNDLTVQASDTFLNNYYLKDIRGIGGKKILIIGSGNIGSKLGLKLVESGANVFLYRRNLKKLKKIIETINYLLPKGTEAKSKAYNLSMNLNNFDVIIGATNGNPVLGLNEVKKINPKSIILDIGKGILSSVGMKKAILRNLKMYRLDVSPAYNAYLENIHSTNKLSNLFKDNFRNYKKIKLIKRGILGEKNHVIVDNVSRPKKIFGITDGFGGMKEISLKRMKKIKNELLN
jgi:hypothetical protein